VRGERLPADLEREVRPHTAGEEAAQLLAHVLRRHGDQARGYVAVLAAELVVDGDVALAPDLEARAGAPLVKILGNLVKEKINIGGFVQI
jgi:hypothetical protein